MDSDWRLRLAAYLLILFLGYYGANYLQARVDHNARRLARLAQQVAGASQREAALAHKLAVADQDQINGGCHRLNIVRAVENRNQLADYRFDMFEVKLVQASLRQQTASVPRTREQTEETVRFIGSLQATANAKEWIGLTDCAAVHGSGYQIPQPVPFRKHRPPPSALHLGPHN